MNLLIEYYIPPLPAVHFLRAIDVRDEAQARELFPDQVPMGIIRSIKPCDDQGNIIDSPTIEEL